MKLALVDSLHPAPWFVTLLVIALAVLAAGPVARADTVYTYTGNPFEIFGGGDSCPTICSITVSFTVPAPLISMSYGTFTPEAFTITDGNTTITNATYDPVNAFFDIATDVTGTPTYWQFQAYNANDSITLFTLN